jgi:predicted nuclease with TOPRIM domain
MSDTPNIAQAREEIGNMARAFRAFKDAENALSVLAAYDNLAQERLAAADAATMAKDDALRDLAVAQEQLAAAKANLAETQEAERQAIANADAEIASKKQDAKDELDNALTEHKSAMQILVDQIATYTPQVAALQARLNELQPQVERAERIAAAVV